MAKNIKALSRAERQTKKAAANNVVKPVNLKSPKGKPARELAAKRAERRALDGKRPDLLALKRLIGVLVTRERKAVYPAHLFLSMTPRQVKHLEKRPTKIEELRKALAAVVVAKQNAEKAAIDTKRAHKARVKAAAVRKAKNAF